MREDGVTGNYVDDGINAGNSILENLIELTPERFESKPRVYDSFDFNGAHVSTVSKHAFKIVQH